MINISVTFYLLFKPARIIGFIWHFLGDTPLYRNRSAELNFIETVLRGILVASLPAYNVKAPPVTNDYQLKDCVSSEEPGPQNRPCPFCLEPIHFSELSIEHKPSQKRFRLEFFTVCNIC